jgi:hypothetical protein
MNVGLLSPPAGTAFIWFLEVGVLTTFVMAALAAMRSAQVRSYERIAFAAFLVELGVLSAGFWTGHADLRSIDEVYLLAVLILLRAGRSRLRVLALCAGAAGVVAAIHQMLFF